MKKIIIVSLITIVLTVALFGIFMRCSSVKQKQYSTEQTKEIINDAYQDQSGFSISGDERRFIEEKGGNPTYGEITVESLAKIIDELQLTHKDVLFDLGSGAGKVCIQVALTTPAQAIGIELSKTRHQLAQKIKQELIAKNILTDPSKLQFFEENILDADLSKGTVFFMCSTCFSDELMQKITDKIAHSAKSAIRIVTLRELPESFSTIFHKYKTLHLPMTWSDGSAVHMYEIL